MGGGDADRGQAIQVGAVLLFGVLILFASSYQAFVVPQQNEEIEFNHNREVQNELQGLRNAVVSLTDAGATRAVRVTLGTSYPSRILFVNPPPPSGSLRTDGTGTAAVNVTVRNATATGDAGDFWDGSAHAYTTGTITYAPSYNRYGEAPRTVYANSAMYNAFGATNLSLAGGSLVQGRQINLVTVNGTLARSRPGSVTVDAAAITASSTRVGLANASAGRNLTLVVPSRLPVDEFTNTTLEGQLLAEGGNVYEVVRGPAVPGTDFHLLEVRLQAGVTYRVRMAQVGVGTDRRRDVGASYLVRTRGNGTVVPENRSSELAVEVRDSYNNPVTGTPVNASASTGSVSLAEDTTDADGDLALTYAAPADVDGGAEAVRVNVSIDANASKAGASFDAESATNVSFSLTVDNTDRSGTGGGGGGGSAYTLSWTDPSGTTGVTCPSDGADGTCTVDASAASLPPLTVETSPTAVGATVEYAVNDTSIGTVSPGSGTTDGAGENATELTPLSDGGLTVFAASGGDGDALVLEITNTVQDLVYNDDATAVDGPDPDGTAGGVQFTMANKFGQTLEVTSVTVSDPPGQVARLSDEEGGGNDDVGETEIYVAAPNNDGFVDFGNGADLPVTADMDADGINQNGNPAASAGGTLTFHLYEFEKNNGDRVDMTGENVDMTVNYRLADGTTGSKSFTASP